ncbi:hypothetical protein B4064_2712 [Caldibacillus thermoamylovorans]|nr:hypothetical protein B4064_2712 [Caldibacillus thermoamylovorans]
MNRFSLYLCFALLYPFDFSREETIFVLYGEFGNYMGDYGNENGTLVAKK